MYAFAVLILLLFIILIEYRNRYIGITKGFFTDKDVKIKNTFGFQRVNKNLPKINIRFIETVINENKYQLSLIINLIGVSFILKSNFNTK